MSEPRFRIVETDDPEIEKAHRMAAETVHQFVDCVKLQDDVAYMAKLRFRNPDLSEETGKDEFIYLWLAAVFYHEEERLLSGVFFEVPKELQKWHQVGDRLGFETDDVFDWMINDKGRVKGGFTLRLTRSRLSSQKEKLEFDQYSGIDYFEPIPE